MSKYKRENFSNKNNVNGINEVDLPNNKFNEYKFGNQTTYYKVREGEIQRPDLICYNVYGTTDKWWLLMKYNKVEDVWNDLFVGMILEVPSTRDLEQYYRLRRNVV
tara:strand:+ start:10689 stop:11006 length:318 start_codon:yes stop_codon:yes gene_type:complete